MIGRWFRGKYHHTVLIRGQHLAGPAAVEVQHYARDSIILVIADEKRIRCNRSGGGLDEVFHNRPELGRQLEVSGLGVNHLSFTVENNGAGIVRDLDALGAEISGEIGSCADGEGEIERSFKDSKRVQISRSGACSDDGHTVVQVFIEVIKPWQFKAAGGEAGLEDVEDN